MAGKATERAPTSSATRKRVAVARGQRLGLARLAAAPDGPDGVDDETGRQIEPVGDHGVTGRALADGAAGRLQALGAGGAVDGAIDAAAPRQPAVRRVDNGINPLGRDVALRSLQQWRHGAGYPAVVEPDEAGTSFSSEKAFVGAVWLLFSPQCENVTTPWIADDPPELPALVTS